MAILVKATTIYTKAVLAAFHAIMIEVAQGGDDIIEAISASPTHRSSISRQFQCMTDTTAVGLIHFLSYPVADDSAQNSAEDNGNSFSIAFANGRSDSATDCATKHSANCFTIAFPADNAVILIPLFS
jgi:hypothetical protein